MSCGVSACAAEVMLPSMSARFCALKPFSCASRYSYCCPASRGMCCCPRSCGPWHWLQLNFLASPGPAAAFSGLLLCLGAAAFCLEKWAASSFISALDSFSAIGDICGSLRLPSRNMKSEVEMNCAGCCASDGTSGFAELPPSPWQAAHRFGSAACVTPENRNATTSAAAFRAADFKKDSLAVRDPVDDPVVIVRHQHRAILQHQHVDRPAPHRRIGLLVLQEAGEEGLGLAGVALLVKLDPHHVVA